jgi:hypothetical protein
VRLSTERNTNRTPCPGDCANSYAFRTGCSRGSWSVMRAIDCSAGTCRMPACTEPEERLNTSANGSVASWRCFGPQQVSRGACPDAGNPTEIGNRVVVPAPESLAAVALFGLEGVIGDGGGGPQELGSHDSHGHPSGGLWDSGHRGPISSTDGQVRGYAYRTLARASGIAADCDGSVLSKPRRTMAGDNSRPPRRP